MNTFGYRLKKLRVARHLTQDRLAEEFNERFGYAFTKATISQYENDKRLPEINVIRNFKDYFNVSLDYLLSNDEFIIKESGVEYEDGYINLEDILSMINSMSLKNKVKFDNEILNRKQNEMLNNCLEIAVELIKREKTK